MGLGTSVMLIFLGAVISIVGIFGSVLAMRPRNDRIVLPEFDGLSMFDVRYTEDETGGHVRVIDKKNRQVMHWQLVWRYDR